MPTATADLVIGSGGGFSVTSGGRLRRVYRVDGLTPGPNIGFDAIAVVQNNGAPIYAQHPTAANYFVDGYDWAPCGDQKSPSLASIWVYVNYVTNTATPNFVLIEFGGSHAQEIINRWPYGPQQGQSILVGYSPETVRFNPDGIAPSDVDRLKEDPFNAQFDTAEIPVESHNVIVRFTRREFASPLAKIQTYRQTVNKTPWYDFPAGQVLMRDITGENLISGAIIAPAMYTVTYEMEISAQPWGWQRVEFFKDIHTGKPIAGVNVLDGTNNGYTLVMPYNSSDFNALKLPDPRKGSGTPPTP